MGRNIDIIMECLQKLLKRKPPKHLLIETHEVLLLTKYYLTEESTGISSSQIQKRWLQLIDQYEAENLKPPSWLKSKFSFWEKGYDQREKSDVDVTSVETAIVQVEKQLGN